jgi:hypothetical protein
VQGVLSVVELPCVVTVQSLLSAIFNTSSSSKQEGHAALTLHALLSSKTAFCEPLLCWHDKAAYKSWPAEELRHASADPLAARGRHLTCVCCFVLLRVLYCSWNARVSMTPAHIPSCTAAQAVPGAAQQAPPRLRLSVGLQQTRMGTRKTCTHTCCDLSYLSYCLMVWNQSKRDGVCEVRCMVWQR